MHFHDQHDLIMDVLSQMARENNKCLDRIKHLLLIKKNNAINQRFWQILDDTLPHHPFNYVGCCVCGYFELCE